MLGINVEGPKGTGSQFRSWSCGSYCFSFSVSLDLNSAASSSVSIDLHKPQNDLCFTSWVTWLMWHFLISCQPESYYISVIFTIYSYNTNVFSASLRPLLALHPRRKQRSHQALTSKFESSSKLGSFAKLCKVLHFANLFFMKQSHWVGKKCWILFVRQDRQEKISCVARVSDHFITFVRKQRTSIDLSIMFLAVWIHNLALLKYESSQCRVISHTDTVKLWL